MSAAGPASNDVDIDLGALFGSLWRAKFKILLAALLLSAVAYMIVSSMAPRYRAETRILIETRESVFTRPDADRQAEGPILDQEGVRSQVEVIGSADLLKRVAQKLDLASREEFTPQPNATMLGQLLVTLGLRTTHPDMGVDERVLQAMRDRLQVYNVENSRVIVIQFSSRDPELAATVPNAIADEYVALQKAAKQQSNADATGWLEPEIADLSKRVQQAESKVAAFRGSSDLLIGQNNAVLATQQLSELSSELSRVRASRAAAEARAASVRTALQSGGALEALPDVVASGLMQRLRERQVQLNNDIADLSTSLLDGHPRIKALRSQLADLNRQINLEARNILESLEKEAEMARQSETKLTRDLNTLKGQSARAGEEEVQLRALEREAAAQRALLETYLTRYREASSRTDRNYLPADARVFSRAATPSEPYFPKKVAIAAATFVGSILLLSVIVLLRELFSGRALRNVAPNRPAQAASEVRMPETYHTEQVPLEPASQQHLPQAAATVRAADIGRSLDQAGRRFSPVTDTPSIHGAMHVAEALIKKGTERVVIVSPEGDEASAASVLLVRTFADRGMRAILLDMTGTGAIGEKMTGRQELSGMTDLLASDKQFTDVIHDDLYSPAHVIPTGNANPARAMRAAERLPIILSALQTAYDVVVVECGPSNAEGVARLMAPGTDIVVSIVDAGDDHVKWSLRDLHQTGLDYVTLSTAASNALPYHTTAPGTETGHVPV